jgi:catechol 2,3-dioxygenase-like lactoylglutathione lyase family enzyme
VVESLHHAAVIVTDVERARRFYGGVLGLSELPRPDFGFDGVWYRVGAHQELHLIVYPEARTLRGTTAIDGRDGHFAMRVRSYTQTLEHLRTHGVPYRALPDNPTPWAQIYVTDPDGNVIELNADRRW